MADRGGNDGIYRRENGFFLIEVELQRIEQLFNTLDPSPFRSRDLDDAAHDYIVGSAREIGPGKPVKLILHLPGDAPADERAVAETIQHYFAVQAWNARLRLLEHLRIGRQALVIGLVFLGACITLRQVLFTNPSGTVAQIIAEGLLICGWVAMWRPFDIMLYDWWPIRRDRRIYEKLSAMPVELRRRQPSPRPSG